MIKIKTSTVINRPIEDVFEFIVDNANDTLWQSDVLETEPYSGDSIAVGTTYKQISQLLGRRIESTWEVTKYEHNREFKSKTISGLIPMEGGFTCEPVAEGETRVAFLGEGNVGGVFKLAEPVVAKMTQRMWETNLSNLKDLLEAQE